MWFILTLAIGLTAVTLTAAVPHHEARADAYCGSGIYGELAPIIAPYQIAQAFCTAVYPVKCTTAAKLRRAAPSTTASTTPKATASSTAKSSTTASVDAKASAWAKAQKQAGSVISSLCACIESTKVCDSITMSCEQQGYTRFLKHTLSSLLSNLSVLQVD